MKNNKYANRIKNLEVYEYLLKNRDNLPTMSEVAEKFKMKYADVNSRAVILRKRGVIIKFKRMHTSSIDNLVKKYSQ